MTTAGTRTDRPHGRQADSPRSVSSATSPGAPPGPRRPHQTASGPGEETDAAVTRLYPGTSWHSSQASDPLTAASLTRRVSTRMRPSSIREEA